MEYQLAEACQNTFILFDCLEKQKIDEEFLQEAQKLLKKENRDDALILIGAQSDQNSLSAQMLVLGWDGTLAEFCGNGSRCAAAYLFQHYPGYENYFLNSHRLERHGEKVYSIQLPSPSFELNPRFVSEEPLFGLQYVETLEPHLVYFGKMGDEELLALGQEINRRKDLFPLGINVNACEVLGSRELYVKTYERGVQRLTRSCGTGSMACAAAFQSKGSVHVLTPGGKLEIDLREDGIALKGEALV
ncbi:MAG: diaminopimelate epimerase [Verrucomicrobia bacterium]|nr:diaminopimelate epimerase [Verrucomicrobiota bacterium]